MRVAIVIEDEDRWAGMFQTLWGSSYILELNISTFEVVR